MTKDVADIQQYLREMRLYEAKERTTAKELLKGAWLSSETLGSILTLVAQASEF